MRIYLVILFVSNNGFSVMDGFHPREMVDIQTCEEKKNFSENYITQNSEKFRYIFGLDYEEIIIGCIEGHSEGDAIEKFSTTKKASIK